MASLSVAIVDDEAVAVRRLARLLRDCPGVTPVGSAGNAADALRLVEERSPDILLLDIEMPGINGIELARRLQGRMDPPSIVFVTAFGRFALVAFDLAAADYLLKPVELPRLVEAIERIRTRRSELNAAERVAELEQLVGRLRSTESEVPGTGCHELWLPVGKGRERVAVQDIVWIGAERDYVRVHSATRSYFLRARIGELAARLSGQGFVRVHRSAIVRLSAVRRVEPDGDRRHRMTLVDGTTLIASRRMADHVRRLRSGMPESRTDQAWPIVPD